MNPWILHDTASVPGGGELRLMQRGGDFVINLGAEALMSSRMRGSEEALAQLSAERIGDRATPAVLIGGLGLGFTLRAALARFGETATITVAELVPAVVAWARGPLAALHGASLDDPRVTVAVGDVGALIRAAPAAFDAILLDVDNGPEGLTRRSNDALYGARGLRAAWTALRLGGVLAVWSVGPDAGFTVRLRKAGFAVEEFRVRAQGPRGTRHVIWLATRLSGVNRDPLSARGPEPQLSTRVRRLKEPDMTTKKTLSKGDKVAWGTPQGETHGTVVKKETGTAKAGGHTAKASKEEPQYRVKSDKSGKEAIHHPEELKKAC